MYALIIDGSVAKYPYSLAEMRADNPDTSFGAEPSDETMEEFGRVRVEAVERPTVILEQVAEEAEPAFIEGVLTQQWTVRDRTPEELAEAKAALRSAVNDIRDALQDGQVETPFGVFDCNERSRVFIHGGVTEAMIRQAMGDDSPLTFTTADNRDVSLTPAQMIAAGRMVLGRISAVHFHARGLKEAIDAAASFADLEQINKDEGWPS